MPWLPKLRVLVPFDFSDNAAEPVETALELVELPSHVHVVYVLHIPHPAEPAALWMKDFERSDRARTALDGRLTEAKLNGVTTHIRSGNPGEEIAELANELGAELIVIPSHSRHGLKRLLLGSVTERVLRSANCPVLVLRRRD